MVISFSALFTQRYHEKQNNVKGNNLKKLEEKHP